MAKSPEKVAVLSAAELLRQIEVLQHVCGEAYQLAGEVGAPLRVLDRLASAAQGAALDPGASFLPIQAIECDVVAALTEQLEEVRRVVGVVPAAAELGRKGGSRTSRAKQRAARENGRKGGRPRAEV